MKKYLKWIVIAVAVIALGLGAYFVFGRNKNDAEKVYVQSVKEVTGASSGAVFSGIVEAQEMRKFKLDSEKTLDECFVNVGDEVKEGDPLFSYNVEELQLAYEQLSLDLESAKSQIETMKDQLAQLEKEKKKAGKDEQNSYTIQIQTLELNIKQQEYEVKKKEAECERAFDAVSNNIVYCDVTGTVRSINENTSSAQGQGYEYYGYNEQPDDSYITVMASGDYVVKGTVTEQNVHSVSEGVPVSVLSRMNDDEWSGVITSVVTEQPEDNNNNYYGVNGEMASKYPFYVQLDSSEGLMMGQHVYICIGGRSSGEGLYLPEFYIFFEGDDAFVYAVNGRDRIEKRKIELGEYNADIASYCVTKGLSEDEFIAFPDETVKTGTGVIYPQEEKSTFIGE